LPTRVYEAGETVGANVRSWGHVAAVLVLALQQPMMIDKRTYPI
jgi:hypothetical protein